MKHPSKVATVHFVTWHDRYHWSVQERTLPNCYFSKFSKFLCRSVHKTKNKVLQINCMCFNYEHQQWKNIH